METLSGFVGEWLARRREALNARFAAARCTSPSLDAQEFLGHVRTTLAPAIDAVAAVFPERGNAAGEALYDLSLELCSKKLLGRQLRHPYVREGWQRLLPALAPLVAREPARVAAAVTNALDNLAAAPGARAGLWLEEMLRLAPQLATVHAFLECGKVLAWRSGMALYRQGALQAARGLNAPLAARCLALPEDTGQECLMRALGRMQADPWLTPMEALQEPPHVAARRTIALVAQSGAFRGFGGEFLRPPVVECCWEGQIAVSDGEASWLLFGDVFGTALVRSDAAQGPSGGHKQASGVSISADGTVRWGKNSTRFKGLEAASFACDGVTLAVTVPTSHRVYLLAQRSEAPA